MAWLQLTVEHLGFWQQGRGVALLTANAPPQPNFPMLGEPRGPDSKDPHKPHLAHVLEVEHP